MILAVEGSSCDKGSNDNDNNNDKKINDPQNPGKDDNKDISDIPEENGSHCLTNDCPKPPSKDPGKCLIESCDPNFQPCHKFGPQEGCKHNPPVIIIKKIVHHTTTHHSSSNSNTGHPEIDENCYSQIKIAWIGKIQRGTNQAIDSIIDRCMGLA